jgi:hypothetical protein
MLASKLPWSCDRLRDQGACHAVYPNISMYAMYARPKYTTGCADSSASTKLAAASRQRADISHTSSCGRLASEAERIICRRSLRKWLPEFWAHLESGCQSSKLDRVCFPVVARLLNLVSPPNFTSCYCTQHCILTHTGGSSYLYQPEHLEFWWFRF